MERRTYLKAAVSAALASPLIFGADTPKGRIQLHVDLTVAPAKEQDMLQHFHKVFKPAAMKQKGYIDVQILKLRSALAGSAPQSVNYRFVLLYESEELRQKWIASDVHQQVWPPMEKMLVHTKYNVLLFDYA
jgi:heme-degrading monooxygenase HmoA